MIQRAKAQRKTEGFRKWEGFVWPEAYPDLAAVQRNPSYPLGTRDSGEGLACSRQPGCSLGRLRPQIGGGLESEPARPTPSPGNSSTQSADHLPQNFGGQKHRMHFTELTQEFCFNPAAWLSSCSQDWHA